MYKGGQVGLSHELEWKVLIRAYPGMPRGGDTGLVIPQPDGALAILIDASGHGLAAYAVAQKARSVILASISEQPDILLCEIHEALKGTIGAAVSIGRIRQGTVDYAGVGNVRASVDLAPLMAQTGVVGHRMRTPRLTTASLVPGQWLLMHTDGVSGPKSLPNGNAESVARKLMELYGSEHDDAGILLLRMVESGP